MHFYANCFKNVQLFSNFNVGNLDTTLWVARESGGSINCERRIYKIHQKKICRILNINTCHLCSYSSSGNGKITKANDIELMDMTPQTILETDKTFEAENQATFEGRTVR